MQLVRPATPYLDSYLQALRRGWSAETHRPEAAAEEIARIEADPIEFLRLMDDPDGEGPPITLPDGSKVKRLPSLRRWMWDGECVGSIGLRWQPGTTDLPPYCLGHIGYGVVPWQRGRGHATSALGQVLTEARGVGLPFVHLVTDVDNAASQQVIRANGGLELERFTTPPEFGDEHVIRWRIDLDL